MGNSLSNTDSNIVNKLDNDTRNTSNLSNEIKIQNSKIYNNIYPDIPDIRDYRFIISENLISEDKMNTDINLFNDVPIKSKYPILNCIFYIIQYELKIINNNKG